jgi:hypothetical protein
MRYSTKGVAAAVMLAGLLALGGEARGQILLVTDVTNLSGFGAPLLAVINEVAHGNTANFELFADGQIDFTEVEALPTVGPIFNSRSCGGCHFQPALGGSGSFINEVRVRNNTAGGPVHIFANDNILRAGPQNQGGVTIFPSGLEATPLGCQITHPSCRKSLCQQEEAARTTFSRRAVALWLDGNRRDAVAEAEKAQRSDEEYVRSTAVLLLTSGALAAGQRDNALARLKALAGHDYRFAEPVDHLATALEAGRDPGDAIGELRAAIASEDHSAEAITGPLLDAFTDAARSSAPAAPDPMEAAR